MKMSKLSSPRKRGSILWIPVFTGMTLFFTLAAFADEPIKPSDYAQPKAAMPSTSAAETVPSRVELNSRSTLPAVSTAVEPQVAATQTQATAQQVVSQPASLDYKVGVNDVLDINVLQPEPMALTVTVSPDGSITFPYIGKVVVNDKTPAEIQDEIQKRLADDYLKYPVVSVALKVSQSKKFYVYGEVLKPGTYLLEDNMTVLKAISTAGGFTKYGSSSRVKVLRPKAKGAGYDMIKVNMKLIMNGLAQDTILEPGDIVQVEEGVF